MYPHSVPSWSPVFVNQFGKKTLIKSTKSDTVLYSLDYNTRVKGTEVDLILWLIVDLKASFNSSKLILSYETKMAPLKPSRVKL